jgi:C_GCAxxG_C_C family probable redox protein
MNADLPTLRPFADDLPALTALLAESGLPHADVAAHLDHIMVAELNGALLGAGGFELCGEGIGLLRSFVVRPDWRGRGLGRRLFLEVVVRAQQADLTDLYLLTTTAQDWFGALGFAPLPRESAPAPIRATRQFSELCPCSAVLMHCSLTTADSAEAQARRQFEDGLYCAESVLLAVAQRCGIDSPLIPAIATGFCSGMARTGGPCGALTGGILALNIVYGREDAGDTVEQNYRQVQRLIQAFEASHGATRCDALLGCHLGTPEGQHAFSAQKLHTRCREFTASAARLAADLIEEHPRK